MSERTIVITGASDGIGASAARTLAAKGEQVVLVGRSPDKTAAVAEELDAPSYVADFAELDQVRELADALLDAHPRIDVLANNAGGILGARALTSDGFEKTFQVNHLAPFLLTHLLLPRLRESRASVIQTSSVASRVFASWDPADLQGERGYSPQRAYGNAKLANILFTRELQRRHGEDGISAAAFHPGVVGSNFGAESTRGMRLIYQTPVLNRLVTISPDRGADQLVWLAEGTPGRDWEPGAYYVKRRATASRRGDDPELARRLWEDSRRLLGLRDES